MIRTLTIIPLALSAVPPFPFSARECQPVTPLGAAGLGFVVVAGEVDLVTNLDAAGHVLDIRRVREHLAAEQGLYVAFVEK